MKLLSICVILSFCMTGVLHANNIAVANVSFTDQNVVGHYCNVKFDLSWDNSWRTSGVPQNWDAAWVFVKYRVTGGVWNHATLNLTGHTAASGSTITPSADGKGVFIYRSADGTGTVNWTNLKLRWNYGVDGVADDATLEVKVFAIEMVNIPSGNFYIGDGDGTNEALYAFHSGTTNSSVQITTSMMNNIRVDANFYDDNQIETIGIGVDGDGGIDTDNNGTVDNPNYPTGYGAFYCMKYELSQEQYVDFLNTLTRAQQISRVHGDISGTTVILYFVMSGSTVPGTRNGIRCDATIPAPPTPVTFYCDLNNNGTGNESNDGQNIACGYISWPDHAAYSDWAGLRPITELEFEKTCRGINAAVLYEFSWGTTNICSNSYTLTNSGSTNEGISNLCTNSGNAKFNTNGGGIGPGRCGVFANSAINKTRQETGAGYYGVMELSGNLLEFSVAIGTIAGRSYTGKHGNGALTASGDADVDFWPGINGNADTYTANTIYLGVTGVTQTAGSSARGGSWHMVSSTLTISDRSTGSSLGPNQNYGARLVRTAP